MYSKRTTARDSLDNPHALYFQKLVVPANPNILRFHSSYKKFVVGKKNKLDFVLRGHREEELPKGDHVKKDERKAVADRIRDNSHLSYHELAWLTSLSYSTITRIAGEFGIRRKTGRKAEPEQES